MTTQSDALRLAQELDAYHTDDEWMFAHLPPYTKGWDGHTTEAKYAAIAAAIRARGNT
jgi:hypothetical protein